MTRSADNAAPGRSLRQHAKALPEHARSTNRTLLLQTLYRSEPISRADLARVTGLTKATVSDLIGSLLGDGLVRELGQRESVRPGKPAVLLDIKRDAYVIIGIDLSEHDRFRGAVLDLDGRVLHESAIPLDGATGEDALSRVLALTDALLALTTAPVLGIGIGTPGVVTLDGVVRTAPNLGWSELALRDRVAAHTGRAVSVGNDANVAVLAEHNYGDSGSDLMLITVGHGIGAGLLVAGAPVHGSRFAAGEIGQVMVGTDLGLDAPYTREQVLEHWLTVPALTAALAGTDDAGRRAVLREAGQRLGVALAPVVGALNLAEVVLAGPEDLLAGPLADAVLETIRHRTMPDSHDELMLRMTSQGADIVLRGAAALVLHTELGLT